MGSPGTNAGDLSMLVDPGFLRSFPDVEYRNTRTRGLIGYREAWTHGKDQLNLVSTRGIETSMNMLSSL